MAIDEHPVQHTVVAIAPVVDRLSIGISVHAFLSMLLPHRAKTIETIKNIEPMIVYALYENIQRLTCILLLKELIFSLLFERNGFI